MGMQRNSRTRLFDNKIKGWLNNDKQLYMGKE